MLNAAALIPLDDGVCANKNTVPVIMHLLYPCSTSPKETVLLVD
jgi:hypothetical protein